ncbi:MAG TPA: amidohydrolase [Solirubrobacteraceae bacterium]|jgi:amidohydrolase|nr:amidohydrolase [Solirubrobacteraceae bacterium]
MQPSTDPLLARLLAALEPELEAAVALRRRLHAAAEPSHEEHRTAAIVAERLPVVASTAAGTGLLARIGSSRSAPVALRAELDGLPIRERTGAPFSATGATMHACGHDIHMAALVALARAAHGLGENLPAPLLAVFQPSEESYPSGARELASGELASIEPAAVLAAHIHPGLTWGSVALDPGTVNAGHDSAEILVEGEPSHAAYPHEGRDPILALAQIVVALHAQSARRIDPMQAATINVVVLEGGSAENVIPAHARARASLRAHRPQDRETLRVLLGETVQGVAAAHGCRASVELIPGEPPLQNDERIAARGRVLLPQAGLVAAAPWRSCGADDFAFFGELAPLGMAFVGLDGAPGFSSRPLHHPELLAPEQAVAAIARTQAALYVAAVSALGLAR